MIRIITLPLLLFLLTKISFGQAIQPGCVSGNFGIDAGVSANRLEFISGTASGTDDWVKSQNGTGIQVIDTTGAAALRTFYTNNPSQVNLIFTKKMPYGYYELAGGNNMLDGICYRDYFGGGNSSGNIDDSTGFLSACKNGDDPTIWSGGYVTMQNKTDIIDGRMYMACYCFHSQIKERGRARSDHHRYLQKLCPRRYF